MRDELNKYLRAKGISTGVHYEPIHHFKVFGKSTADLPVTERVWRRVLTLPLYADITEDEFEQIAKEVIKFGEDNNL